jgi:1-acyl-sn-glycerol-3-phosphate acyltransferase
MYKPRQNKLVSFFFSWYINRIILSDFHAFDYNKVDYDPDKAILLLSNHFSWWDGFLMFQLNRLYFKKRFHVMITEENYKNIWFLKYLGSFSVKKGSRSSVESLKYAGELLDDPKNLLLIFPQGKLYSNHIMDVDFQKGIEHIIKSSRQKFQYLFSAVFIDYFNQRKPMATCYLRNFKPEVEENNDFKVIETAFNSHYKTSHKQQISVTV